RPLVRRIDRFRLAAEVEREYPRLGERLLTTVDLARTVNVHNGSPHLIDALAYETDLKTRPMDFGRADPQRANGWLLIGVAAVTAAPAAIGGSWPEDCLGLG